MFNFSALFLHFLCRCSLAQMVGLYKWVALRWGNMSFHFDRQKDSHAQGNHQKAYCLKSLSACEQSIQIATQSQLSLDLLHVWRCLTFLPSATCPSIQWDSIRYASPYQPCWIPTRGIKNQEVIEFTPLKKEGILEIKSQIASNHNISHLHIVHLHNHS